MTTMKKGSMWSLTWCIGHQDWSTVRGMLEINDAERGQLADADHVATLLSFAITYDAPFDIIKSILTSNPKAILTPCGRAAIKFATHANASLQTTVFLHVTRQQQEVAQFSQPQAVKSRHQSSKQTLEYSSRPMRLQRLHNSIPLPTTNSVAFSSLSFPHLLEKSLEISDADDS